MLIAAGLVGFIALAMWQLSRLGFMLAKSEQTVHRLEYQDALTTLPNHRDVLDLFDQALVQRTPDRMIECLPALVAGLSPPQAERRAYFFSVVVMPCFLARAAAA